MSFDTSSSLEILERSSPSATLEKRQKNHKKKKGTVEISSPMLNVYSQEEAQEAANLTPNGTKERQSRRNGDFLYGQIMCDPTLKLLDNEPEFWFETVDKQFLSTLTESQKKRQEAIYQLILNEKRHCRILRLIKKIYATGMEHTYMNLSKEVVDGIFPRLDILVDFHTSFLTGLRKLQERNKYIDNIGELLIVQFSKENAKILKDAYGTLLRKQGESETNYNELLRTNSMFKNFIKVRSTIRLMEKTSVIWHWMLLNKRCMQYPDNIMKMITNCNDHPNEKQNLETALVCVKDISKYANFEQLKYEMEKLYTKIDVKTSAMFKSQKYKKCDLMKTGRKLCFTGEANIRSSKGKVILVRVLVMSDLLVFLQEVNHKFYFISKDNKIDAIIPVENLILRTNSVNKRGIFLVQADNDIGTTHLYELECLHPIERNTWIEAISEVIDQCPSNNDRIENTARLKTERKLEGIICELQTLDCQLAQICERKELAIQKLLSTLEIQSPDSLEQFNYQAVLQEQNGSFDLCNNSSQNPLDSSIASIELETNLGRSISSACELQRAEFEPINLKKRVNTFGGFERRKGKNKIQEFSNGTIKENEEIDQNSSIEVPSLASKFINSLNAAKVLSEYHQRQYEICIAAINNGETSPEERKVVQLHTIEERSKWVQEMRNYTDGAQPTEPSNHDLLRNLEPEALPINYKTSIYINAKEDFNQRKQLFPKKLTASEERRTPTKLEKALRGVEGYHHLSSSSCSSPEPEINPESSFVNRFNEDMKDLHKANNKTIRKPTRVYSMTDILDQDGEIFL